VTTVGVCFCFVSEELERRFEFYKCQAARESALFHLLKLKSNISIIELNWINQLIAIEMHSTIEIELLKIEIESQL